MTLTLEVPSDLEERLLEEAQRRAVPVASYVLQVLRTQVPPTERAARGVQILQSWIDATPEEAAEQKATGDFLVKALDQDRPADRLLFPPELEGITW